MPWPWAVRARYSNRSGPPSARKLSRTAVAACLYQPWAELYARGYGDSLIDSGPPKRSSLIAHYRSGDWGTTDVRSAVGHSTSVVPQSTPDEEGAVTKLTLISPLLAAGCALA